MFFALGYDPANRVATFADKMKAEKEQTVDAAKQQVWWFLACDRNGFLCQRKYF